MHGTTKAPLDSCICRLDQNLWHGQQDWAVSTLEKIGCPPKLLSIIASFQIKMHSTVSFDEEISEPFKTDSEVKQGFVLAPTHFGISSQWCLFTPLVQPQMASTCTPDMMTNYSTWNGYKKRPKSLCLHMRNAFCWWCCAGQPHTRRPSVPHR